MSGEVWLEEQLRRYTASMTTSLIAAPAAAPEAMPIALTGADAERIAAAIDAARTESTRRVYAYTWGQWARWCAARNLSPLPGEPAALCAYLTERADRSRALPRSPAAGAAPAAGRRCCQRGDGGLSSIVQRCGLALPTLQKGSPGHDASEKNFRCSLVGMPKQHLPQVPGT